MSKTKVSKTLKIRLDFLKDGLSLIHGSFFVSENDFDKDSLKSCIKTLIEVESCSIYNEPVCNVDLYNHAYGSLSKGFSDGIFVAKKVDPHNPNDMQKLIFGKQ